MQHSQSQYITMSERIVCCSHYVLEEYYPPEYDNENLLNYTTF